MGGVRAEENVVRKHGAKKKMPTATVETTLLHAAVLRRPGCCAALHALRSADDRSLRLLLAAAALEAGEGNRRCGE